MVEPPPSAVGTTREGLSLTLKIPRPHAPHFGLFFAAVETRCFADNRINKITVSHAIGFGFNEPRRGINDRRDNCFASCGGITEENLK